MMHTILLGLLLALATPALAATPAGTPGDFASGMRLDTRGDQPFYRIELPLAVYGQARPDLADVRVFNAAGEPVPYALEALQPPAAKVTTTLRALPFFPVRGSAGSEVGSLDVKIEQGREGRIIALRSQDGTSAGSRTLAYLLDLSALRQPVQALRLDWPASADGYSADVRLEASDDLRSWQTLTVAPLVDMRFGGHQLLQKRIPFAAGEHRYLRLTADTPLPALSAAQAEALPGNAAPSPSERWHEVQAEAGTAPGEYVFRLGAYLTATAVEIRLPETNMVAPVELLSRAREQDPWQSVARTTVYRIARAGGEVSSPALAIPARAGRYWLLRLDPRTGSLGSGMPVLRLAWTPQQLVFLARGQGPFTLAWGQRDAAPAQLPLTSLIPGYRAGMDRELPQAILGPTLSLGGDAAPRPGQEDQPPADWKRWLLWSVLLAGVLLLALMARSLLQQMPRQN